MGMFSSSYVNQDESLTDLQILMKYSFLLNFLHELVMSYLSFFTKLFRNVYSVAVYLLN